MKLRTLVFCVVGAIVALVGWWVMSGTKVSGSRVEKEVDSKDAVRKSRDRGRFVGSGFVSDESTSLVRAKICAHFAGTSLFPTLLIEQGLDEQVSIQVSALDGSKADVWCGDIPLGLLNGSVLEDVSVVSEGHPLVMLVFTFWRSDGTRYDRVKLLKRHSNVLMWSIWRDGVPWSPIAELPQSDIEYDEEPSERGSVIDRLDEAPATRTPTWGQSTQFPTVSLYPWCPIECTVEQQPFYLEINASGIITM